MIYHTSIGVISKQKQSVPLALSIYTVLLELIDSPMLSGDKKLGLDLEGYLCNQAKNYIHGVRF